MKIWKVSAIYFFVITVFFCLVDEKIANAATTSTTALKHQLQKILDKSLEDTDGTGVVCLIKTPSFQWGGSSGFADYSKKRPMKTTDMLRLASMTKTFVSVVVQKLAEEGKLNLDDKIKKHLPHKVTTRIPYGSKITIRQLLNMTSGIKSYTENDVYNDTVESNPYRSAWTPEEIVRYIYNKKAVFPPGKGWDYSNTNYILLDMIVKKAAGTLLATEMRRVIHAPLKLNNTFMEIQEKRSEGFNGLTVRGYDENGKDVTEIQDGFGLGDGGLISDANGVAKFFQALFIDRIILSPVSLKQMKNFSLKGNYGLGLERVETTFGDAWGHSGSSFGFSGEMLYLPGRKIIFVILTNDENDSNISDIVFIKSIKLLLTCPKSFL